MKRVIKLLSLFVLGMMLVACSNTNESKDSSYDMNTNAPGMGPVSDGQGERGDYYEGEIVAEDSSDFDDSGSPVTSSKDDFDISQTDRKIIYTANLDIEVKDYQEAVDEIVSQVAADGGYIIKSQMYSNSGDGSIRGEITIRIPQEKFNDFINLIKNGAYKVLHSSTEGQDVTEEYVDLQSRLKSKRVVEERLLSFMEKAEKTEDLLKISNDLGRVQEEIETILGRMKYLENRSDLATIQIKVQEKNTVSITSLNEDELWIENVDESPVFYGEK